MLAVLFTAGDHVPLMLLVDNPGSAKEAPLQIGDIGLKTGMVSEFMDRSSVIMESQPLIREGIVVF